VSWSLAEHKMVEAQVPVPMSGAGRAIPKSARRNAEGNNHQGAAMVVLLFQPLMLRGRSEISA
jgi:hypothetical protein